MKGEQKDLHNETRSNTITPNHNGMPSPIEFETNTIDHVRLSGYFLFKTEVN